MTSANPHLSAPLLSLCMIVRNEEQYLARCLESVRRVVDEMIVVDTGSTDRTPEIAGHFGASVIHSPWQHDFSQARNVALNHARGRWVLCLDADESLLAADGPALRSLLLKATPPEGEYPHTAFNLIVRNAAAGAQTGGSAYIIRLFPNRPDVRFEWRVHEQVGTSLLRAGLGIQKAPITLLHTGYSDPETNRRKQTRNRELLLRQIEAGEHVTAMTYFLLAGCYLDLNEPATALSHYTTCRNAATASLDLARGATVRMVTCLLVLNRHRDALALMPAVLDRSWHPEMVLDRATVSLALEGSDSAVSYFEAVLHCVDRPEIPVCNVSSLKVEALKFLGGYWHEKGHGARAVKLLRAAVAIGQTGADFSPADLAALYQSAP